jgi:hypothetical protein
LRTVAEPVRYGTPQLFCLFELLGPPGSSSYSADNVRIFFKSISYSGALVFVRPRSRHNRWMRSSLPMAAFVSFVMVIGLWARHFSQRAASGDRGPASLGVRTARGLRIGWLRGPSLMKVFRGSRVLGTVMRCKFLFALLLVVLDHLIERVANRPSRRIEDP